MSQLHKKFTTNQVKELFARYSKAEIPRKYIQEVLGIKHRRFFALLAQYRQDPDAFSIAYQRREPTRQIADQTEGIILRELAVEKKIIADKANPVHRYNYTYIKDLLAKDHKQSVSLSTIIDRAKKYGFYMKRSKQKTHDREVLTNYAGELIQHDSSLHLWAPAAREKWSLITSLDDHSRFLLFADLVRRESSWAHISALQSVFLKYGFPFSYYVDSHSIFRFVKGRDSDWSEHRKITDEVDPQWKQVLQDCGVKIIYALSPQAKGKIERPYQWLQDRVVRTCVRDNTTDIRRARTLLQQEVDRYNYRQVHSTTLEVPYFRLQKALREKRSLFRQFQLKPPFKSVKDMFCLKAERMVDAYRRVSLNNRQLPVNKANPNDYLVIRFYLMTGGVTELRFWRDEELLDVQRLKTSDLEGVQF